MRVLHVTDGYLPRLGGIEIHVHDLVCHQRAAGVDARVLTGLKSGAADPADPAWVTRATARQAVRLLVADRPDVVHVHFSILSPFGTQVVREAATLGIPLVATMHSLWVGWGPIPQLATAALGRARRAAVWSAVSSPAAAAVASVLGGDIPVHVVGNAVEPDAWRPDRPAPVATTGEPCPVTVVSVMRLTRTKRTVPLADMLLDARDRLPGDVPLRGVVIGDGPQRAALERRLARGGADSWVRLTGALDRSAVRRELQEADIFLAPAEREAFGIAALEARAAGLAVVASSRSGVADFVRHGQEGLLAPDDAGMAAAVARLAADPALLGRIRAHNTLVPPAHDWPRAVAGVAELYDRALGVAARDGDGARTCGGHGRGDRDHGAAPASAA
jgi:glycosyltransferase involved in cell wall biosynthesis